MELKSPGDLLYQIGTTYPETGGSQYRLLNQIQGGAVPKVRREAKKNMQAVTRAIDRGYVRSCHDLSDGGLAVAAAEMAIGGGLGLNLNLDRTPCAEPLRDDFKLFSESNSRFLVEVARKDRQPFEKIARSVSFNQIATVTSREHLVVKRSNGRIEFTLGELDEAWKRGLEI